MVFLISSDPHTMQGVVPHSWQRSAQHRIASHRIASHRIASHCIASHHRESVTDTTTRNKKN
jgi:hypothetical protein